MNQPLRAVRMVLRGQFLPDYDCDQRQANPYLELINLRIPFH